MKKKGYNSAKYYVLLLFILIPGIMLIITLSAPDLILDWFDFLGSSEIIYVVPVLLILFIIATFILVRATFKHRAASAKRLQEKTQEIKSAVINSIALTCLLQNS